MPELPEELGNALHFCIDMQRLFSAERPWATSWKERVTPRLVELVAAAPARTIFTRFISPTTGEYMPDVWRAYYRKWRSVTLSEVYASLPELLPALGRFVLPARVFDKGGLLRLCRRGCRA